MWDVSVPCIARGILNHWATREVPLCIVFSKIDMTEKFFKNYTLPLYKQKYFSSTHNLRGDK